MYTSKLEENLYKYTNNTEGIGNKKRITKDDQYFQHVPRNCNIYGNSVCRCAFETAQRAIFYKRLLV